MRSEKQKMTGQDWIALAIVVAVVIWILMLLGPAIDADGAFVDARMEANAASLVQIRAALRIVRVRLLGRRRKPVSRVGLVM